MTKKPIPVCLLTGYLGAGKTTLMNYILNQHHGYHVAIIVNDVGEVNIDARLIAEGGNIQKEDSGSLVSLSNGCACCTLKDDLAKQLYQLCQTGKFDYILMEASGIANPITIANTVTLLDQYFDRDEDAEPLCYMDNIVTVVDALRFVQEFSCGDDIADKSKVGEESIEALLIDQIEFCNTVILNKIDMVSAEDLEHVRSVVKALSPEAKIIETTHSKVDLKEILGTEAFDYEKVSVSSGWIKALESDAKEEEEHEHEHHHHHDDDDDDEDEHEHHHHHDDDDDDDEDEHEHHHHHHDDDEDEHEHHHHHHDDDYDDDEDEHEHHHDHGPDCTCGCHDHHHHHHDHVKYGVETFVYYRRRPFNAAKFAAVIRSWGSNVIRSKGFVWFDNDRDHAYIFEQSGKQISPLTNDGLWVAAEDADVQKEIIEANPELLDEWDKVYGDRMIRLAIIGQKMDKKKMIAELDATLSD